MEATLPQPSRAGTAASILWPSAVLIAPYVLNDFYFLFANRLCPASNWVFDIVSYVLVPTGLFVWLVRSGRVSLREIGLFDRPRLLDLALALPAAFVAFMVSHNWIEWWIQDALCPQSFCVRHDFPATEPARSWLILYAALTAGLFEEILERGVLLTALRKVVHRRWVAAVIGSAVFSITHWCQGIGQLAFTFLFGLAMSTWYLRRRPLLALIVFHTAYDWVAFTVA